MGNQIRNFPKQLIDLQNRLQEKYLRNGYPTRIGEYTLDFSREINRLIMNGIPFTKTQVNIVATEDSNPPSSNNQVKKKRKKKLQVSKANTVPAPDESPEYQPYEPPQLHQSGNPGRGHGGRRGRGSNLRGRGAPKRSDFYNYSERNTNQYYNQKPTCLKCGSSRELHVARDCRSQVWCNQC